MSENKIVTGILSYGMSGRVFHAPFIEVNPNFELRGIVERSKKAAHEKYPQIISYNSVDELINDPEIELVIVNTPNDTHVEFALQALKAGKHVLIEKPFAPTMGEANMLFQVAKDMGKQILPFHNRRFDSDFLALKKIINQNEVGRPIELHIRFDRFKPQIGPKVFKETKVPAAGVLFDLGSHLLDQTISLFGKPKAMTKVRGVYRPDSKVDDYGCIILNYASGLNVYITTSLLVANPQASFVLHGTKGSFVKNRTDVQEAQLIEGMMPNNPAFGIEPEGTEGILTTSDEDENLVSRFVQAELGHYMGLFDEVYQTIREGKPYFVSRDQIIWQLEILEPNK
ncbi:Gfo/Idh/MocA family oxidoreductase [Sphingobacterium endophyticum]|uniref:Gfo/Idh/MocA family oxidoreductase n=1 Tax=Sphingobacterium endophyticum TaxID=2546448 RepID=UPI0012E230EA|nr:Gfo/Idh/MocA family oxidoreductase [Sphingobacterium endophyticum]